MKRLFLTIIVICFPIFLFAEEVEVNGLFYDIYKNEAEVIKSPHKYKGDIIIPESILYKGKKYNVNQIGEDAFRQCDDLYSVLIPNSIYRIKQYAFCDSKNLKSVQLSKNLEIIDNSAFNGCMSLDEISLPDKLVGIGSEAFAYCDNLKSLFIPKSVRFIDDGAFSGCFNMTEIKVDKDNIVFDSRYECNAIIETNSNTLITGCVNTVIPLDVVNIGKLAFSGNKNLISITIPQNVTNIETGAFTWSGLERIEIPNNVIHIGEFAFQSCLQLDSLVIPESVLQIDEVAFSNCKSLSSLTILGDNIRLEKCAFADCKKLKDVFIYGKSKINVGEDVFEYNSNNNVLHVKKELLSYYKEDNRWKYSFKKIVAIGNENSMSFGWYIIGFIIGVISLYYLFKSRENK